MFAGLNRSSPLDTMTLQIKGVTVQIKSGKAAPCGAAGAAGTGPVRSPSQPLAHEREVSGVCEWRFSSVLLEMLLLAN